MTLSQSCYWGITEEEHQACRIFLLSVIHPLLLLLLLPYLREGAVNVTDYLIPTYGYLTSLATAERENAITDVMEELKLFQDFFCLKSNGAATEKPVNFMSKLCCEVPDFPIPITLTTEKWNKNQ